MKHYDKDRYIHEITKLLQECNKEAQMRFILGLLERWVREEVEA